MRAVLCTVVGACAVASVAGRTLSEGEVQQLLRVKRGEVGKDELEVVLAQYDEDLSWAAPYENVRTVYCKGSSKCVQDSIPLPNVGREGHTFLHHIVHNYDKLAKWTVFSQAGEPSFGYKGHRGGGGGHMLHGASFEDYLLHPQRAGAKDPDALFLMTSKVHMPTMSHALRSTFQISEGQVMPKIRALPDMCPTVDGGADQWGPYGLVEGLAPFIAEKCGVEESAVGEAVLSFWDNSLQLPRPRGDIAHYAQGARFAASRDRIHQRPKEFYQQLLEMVNSDSDPCLNYLFEWVWYYIIGAPEEAPCPVFEEEMARSWQGAKVRFLSGVSGSTTGTDVDAATCAAGAALPLAVAAALLIAQ